MLRFTFWFFVLCKVASAQVLGSTSPDSAPAELSLWVTDDAAVLWVDGDEALRVPMRAPAARPGESDSAYDDAMLIGDLLLLRRGVLDGPGLSRPAARSVELYNSRGERLPVEDPELMALLSAADAQLLSPSGQWSAAVVDDGQGQVLGVVMAEGESLRVVRPDRPVPMGPAWFEGERLMMAVDPMSAWALDPYGQQSLQPLS